MRFFFSALFLLMFFMSTCAIQSQETTPMPYALYGKLPAPAPSFATPEDRRIATWLEADREKESETATWVLKHSRSEHVTQLAERVARDNDALKITLRRWGATGADVETPPVLLQMIQSPLVQASDKLVLKDIQNLSASELDETYLKLQLSASQRQIEACKLLSPHVSPGFRNHLENIAETTWRHQQDAILAMKSLKSDSKALARK